jgi:hypothetical protein
MEIKQLIGDDEDVLQSTMNARIAQIQTSMPGIIISYNPGTNLAEVQPGVMGKLFYDDYSKFINLPVLNDVPVIFLSSGGYTITTPIQVNTPCIIFFSSRDIQSYMQLGGILNDKVQPRQTLEQRMHDLTDCYVIPCSISQPEVIPNISVTDIQIRNSSGSDVIGISPTSGIYINTSSAVQINSTGNTSITAPTTAITGNLTVSGTIVANGEITGNAIPLSTHTHSGIQPGSGNSGGPQA